VLKEEGGAERNSERKGRVAFFTNKINQPIGRHIYIH